MKATTAILPIVELIVVMGVAMWPMFLLASRVDQDEWAKAALGGAGLTIIQIYKLWQARHQRREATEQEVRDEKKTFPQSILSQGTSSD